MSGSLDLQIRLGKQHCQERMFFSRGLDLNNANQSALSLIHSTRIRAIRALESPPLIYISAISEQYPSSEEPPPIDIWNLGSSQGHHGCHGPWRQCFIAERGDVPGGIRLRYRDRNLWSFKLKHKGFFGVKKQHGEVSKNFLLQHLWLWPTLAWNIESSFWICILSLQKMRTDFETNSYSDWNGLKDLQTAKGRTAEAISQSPKFREVVPANDPVKRWTTAVSAKRFKIPAPLYGS